MAFTCQYCTVERPTAQGLRSHLAQSKPCRKKHFEEYAAESSESESDNDNLDAPIPNIGPEDSQDSLWFEETEWQNAESDDDTHPGALDPPRLSPDPNDAKILPPHTEEATRRRNKRVTMEEVEDEDARWIQPFPEQHAAGAILSRCKTGFEAYRELQRQAGCAPWEPFESEDEWEMAHWLMTSGLSQKKVDGYLKLKKVRDGIKPSFHNNRAFLQRIDALPHGPEWRCYPFTLVGDELDADGQNKEETVEMWCRDPVECVRELVGNTAFTQAYEPCRIFKRFEDGEYSNREFNEMWTAEWWWEIQELLPKGATLVPIILASDKTQLTRFSGDQQAWPVYLTIGNIDKATRRAPSSRATVLLGYIPVAKLEIFKKSRRSGEAHQLFHECMRTMLESLKVAGREGVTMDCADGFVRKMYLIFAAYIADYPEQCLICCCKENSCPGCLCHPKRRGDTCHFRSRDPEETLRILSEQSKGEYPTEFVEQNLRPIKPFWAHLPHCNIFRSMTPDLLHELHNGAFGDHTVKWSTSAIRGGADEVDQRFRAMTPHPSLRHFKKGISLTTQWTGKERKNMEKVFLGVLANATDDAVIRATRGILDFIHYAHFETHCDESLVQLDAAWLAFHDNKYIFEDLEIREHFNISKIHKLKHYVDSIRSRGTTDGFNSEGTERLHIDLAKVAYNASNKRAYTRQMTVWLRRQEAVHKFGTYLQWAVPGYTAPTNSGGDIDAVEEEDDEHEPEPTTPDSDTEDSDDEGEVEELSPAFTVAKTPGFPTVTVAAIQADFHAPDFIRNLGRFLQTKGITPRLQPALNTTFPLYKRLSFTLAQIPEVGSTNVRDTVRAVRSERSRITPKGIIPAKPGQFDTVLVRVQPRGVNETPTDGLCVARVRVIFRIPDDFGQYPDPVAVSAFGLILGITMDTCSLAGKPAKMKESSMIVDSGGYVLPCR
ncbi:hypothetical protein C8F04DRAFT_1182372 [Mycena alexandri]|uniref:Transposase n=1 Tax=Mycena alexandri TaxID=1745969 RepID=A0AAD6SZ16_9AGAR|nr:hypothetical protein C8F04DRAFT_1197842 [Mycena alexandri]KAJ7035470.1 hypothetical protein C8F04DRAFT_1182372 [Mycena alexandri]